MANDGRGSLLERHTLLLMALRDPSTSKGDCAVLGAISEHADPNGHGWPGVELLARKLSISRTTVMRSVARLEARGYLEVDRNEGLSNYYRLADTSSAGATGTRSADATGEAPSPVAPTHTTSSVGATGPVAPMRRDPSHQCDPNSVQELSLLNSVQRTQLVASQSKSEQLEQVFREKTRREYMEALTIPGRRHVRVMESTPGIRKYIEDLIQEREKAA